MKIDQNLTDEAILQELGSRLAASRLQANLSQEALAEQAGIAKRTLERLESGEVATQLASFLRVCRALGLMEKLDTLIPGPVVSPIAQLKLKGRQRRRASGKSSTVGDPPKWTWSK
jgi:transcriptional regulator with XRE-family HTH domain